MTRIILVRHANTFEPNDTPYWIGANEDLRLSNSGREQLSGLKTKVAGLIGSTERTVVASPLKRALTTAEVFEAPIVTDTRLTELDFGGWSGKTEAGIVAEFGEDSLRLWRDRCEVPAAWGLERTRIDGELNEFLTACLDRKLTVAVTSNGRLKLLGKLLGGSGGWNVKTAGVCDLVYADGVWRIMSWNG